MYPHNDLYWSNFFSSVSIFSFNSSISFFVAMFIFVKTIETSFAIFSSNSSGSLANKQGRIIGTNLAGGHAEFEGAVGSFVIKLFEISIAGAGLSFETARREGFDALRAFVVQFDRAHFYPEKDLLYMELVVEKDSGLVLGIQGLGGRSGSVVARVNAVSAILKYKPTIKDISNLELPYSPPFSAAMDILNALGNTAENIMA
ncbi:MAG: hypothetical protein SVY10_21730, partial [Thermodesulfobacteriota bacterium]|nr:hypothetical protein [Thermodesulfobacteriota bacterium]